jgi:hypothetical protein
MNVVYCKSSCEHSSNGICTEDEDYIDNSFDIDY